MHTRKKYLLVVVFLLAIASNVFGNNYSIADSSYPKNIIQFIFCSDLHFGLTKANFRGQTNVSAALVNEAMVEQMNKMPSLSLPNDDGVAAGEKIAGIDAVIVTGDITNRQEKDIQSATDSWKEFEEDYLVHLKLVDKNGNKSKLLLTPGNHDISNAIGFHRPMNPLTDNASLRNMYNLMIEPSLKKTEYSFNYATDKINYSKDISGVHLIFVDAWPDSAERVWMEKDLKKINANQFVLLFTHSPADVEARFFMNPNGNHSINDQDQFENLVAESFKDGLSVKETAMMEEQGFAAFLKAHSNIKAYFHGHSNYTEYYDWKGPDQNILLHCFRVDSPMKGKISSKDETKLSFELITIDVDKQQLTVRECLWNAHPFNISQNIDWGVSKTVSF